MLHFSTNGIIKHCIILQFISLNGIIKHGIILQYFISLQMA